MAEKNVDNNVFVGSANGLLKALRITEEELKHKNLHVLDALDPKHAICCMAWRDSTEVELLMGLRNQVVKVYDTQLGYFKTSLDVKGGSGPLTGLAVWDDCFVTAVESGLVKVWRSEPTEQIEFTVGGKKDQTLSRMKQSKGKTNIIATGGKNNEVCLWDLNSHKQPVFKAKAVAPDRVQLHVPVWVTDIDFLPDSEKIVMCSRHSHIRLYDPKSPQRRPVVDMSIKDEPWMTISATSVDHQVIAGGSKGTLAVVDMRNKALVHCLKGPVGGIRCVAGHPSYPIAVSVGIDKHLRIHDVNTRKMLHEVYLRTDLNSVLLRSNFWFAKRSRPEDDDDDVILIDSADACAKSDPLWDTMEILRDETKARQKRKRQKKGHSCDKIQQ